MRKAAFVLMVLSVISKIIGMVREMFMSYFYGTNIVKDAMVVSNLIPTVIFGFVATGVVTSFIPIYTKIKHEKGKDEVNLFVSNLLNILMVAALGIVILGILFTEPLVSLFAMGYKGEQQALTVQFTRISFVVIFATLYGAVFRGYLNAERDFATPATNTIIYNILMIVFIILSTKTDVYVLAIGMVIAGFLQYSLYPRALRKVGYEHRWVMDPKDENLRRMVRMSGPIILSSATMDLSGIIDKSIASTIMPVGGVASLDYAFRLIVMVAAIVVYSVAAAVYPRITELGQRGEVDEMKKETTSAIVSTLVIVVPAVVGLIILAKPIVSFVFGRGEFGMDSVLLVATELCFYAPYLIGLTIREISARAFYALRDFRTPVIIMVISVGIDVTLNFVLSSFMGIYGLPLATTIGCTVGAITMTVMLRKKVGRLGLREQSIELAKILIASAVMGAVAYFTFQGLGGGTSKLALFSSILLGVFVYGITGILLKIRAIGELFGIIKNRIKIRK